jgi:acyl carrier protein
MDRSEIESRVKKVIARVLKLPEDGISSDANFIFDLGADSMQSLLLVAGFEEEFEIEMPEDQALAVQTISGAVEFITLIIQKR